MSPSLKIMVIEDYDDLREAILEVLAQDGHQVVGVPSAEDVDDEPTGFIPDLYIIDVNLPGENGISLAQRILRHHSNARIIIASARTSVQDRIAGYQSGANIYLTKPLELEELKAVVNSLGPRIVSDIEIPDRTATLNQLSLVLTGPAGKMQLTRQEAVLLCAFTRVAQQTLEHWQVAQHLGDGASITKDNLEVKIGRLRKKLSICGIAYPTIQVMRGYGYQLCFRVILQTGG